MGSGLHQVDEFLVGEKEGLWGRHLYHKMHPLHHFLVQGDLLPLQVAMAESKRFVCLLLQFIGTQQTRNLTNERDTTMTQLFTVASDASMMYFRRRRSLFLPLDSIEVS